MRSISTDADERETQRLGKWGGSDPPVHDVTSRVLNEEWKATRENGCHETRRDETRRADPNVADGRRFERETRRRATEIEDTYLRLVHQRESHEGGDGDAKPRAFALIFMVGSVGLSKLLLYDAPAREDLDRSVHSGSESRFVGCESWDTEGSTKVRDVSGSSRLTCDD